MRVLEYPRWEVHIDTVHVAVQVVCCMVSTALHAARRCIFAAPHVVRCTLRTAKGPCHLCCGSTGGWSNGDEPGAAGTHARSPVRGCVFAFSFRLFALLVGLARLLACLSPTCAVLVCLFPTCSSACLFVSHLRCAFFACFPLALCVRTHAQKLSLVLHERALRRLLVLHRLMQLCAARASKHRHGSAAACALPGAHVPPLRESRGEAWRGVAWRGAAGIPCRMGQR